MTVYFIGAGPGAADLITVRGLKLIQQCPVCLYAGSLVSEELLALIPKDTHCVNTADLNLDEIIAEIKKANLEGKNVARIHSGDPSIYGAIAEQMRALDALQILYEVIPGVPAFAAAAAAMKQELTLPAINQSLILTRTSVNSSPMPKLETLENLAKSRATMAIHLSARNVAEIQRELIPIYGADCPVVVAFHVSWPDQKIVRSTLAKIDEKIASENITKTAIIFVGWALQSESFETSSLYAVS